MKLLNKIVLFDIDYTLFDTKEFKASNLEKFSLYKEVLPVLELFPKNLEVGIFSKGEAEFQKLKLQKTGIQKYFQQKHVHIFENKNENLEKIINKYLNMKIYLVDDKLEVLCNAKKINSSIFTIWIERGPYAQNKRQNFSPDLIVQNLNEIIPLLI
jgi:FMN phosphatase YigB (HAD superfamily)